MSSFDLEVLPAYWGIETNISFSFMLKNRSDLEVLPAYWGIETNGRLATANAIFALIWKYYPPTGVLKQVTDRSVN